MLKNTFAALGILLFVWTFMQEFTPGWLEHMHIPIQAAEPYDGRTCFFSLGGPQYRDYWLHCSDGDTHAFALEHGWLRGAASLELTEAQEEKEWHLARYGY